MYRTSLLPVLSPAPYSSSAPLSLPEILLPAALPASPQPLYCPEMLPLRNPCHPKAQLLCVRPEDPSSETYLPISLPVLFRSSQSPAVSGTLLPPYRQWCHILLRSQAFPPVSGSSFFLYIFLPEMQHLLQGRHVLSWLLPSDGLHIFPAVSCKTQPKAASHFLFSALPLYASPNGHPGRSLHPVPWLYIVSF